MRERYKANLNMYRRGVGDTYLQFTQNHVFHVCPQLAAEGFPASTLTPLIIRANLKTLFVRHYKGDKLEWWEKKKPKKKSNEVRVYSGPCEGMGKRLAK